VSILLFVKVSNTEQSGAIFTVIKLLQVEMGLVSISGQSRWHVRTGKYSLLGVNILMLT
jgi:hypothetical protein